MQGTKSSLAWKNSGNTDSVAVFASKFKALALGRAKWVDGAALRWIFVGKLHRDIQGELPYHGTHHSAMKSLEEVIAATIKAEVSLAAKTGRKVNTNTRANTTAPATTNKPLSQGVPMDVDTRRTRISQEERDRRKELGLCYRCASKDHAVRDCPTKPGRPLSQRIQGADDNAVSTTQNTTSNVSRTPGRTDPRITQPSTPAIQEVQAMRNVARPQPLFSILAFSHANSCRSWADQVDHPIMMKEM